MNQQELERLAAIEKAVGELQTLLQEFRIGTKWARRTLYFIAGMTVTVVTTAETWRAWLLWLVTGK